MFGGGSLVPTVHSGKVRGLAVGGDQRSTLFGDVPTFKEKGFPQMYARAWWGIVTTAGTPRPVINKIHVGIKQVIDNKEFRDKRMLAQGLQPVANSPDAFAELIRKDSMQWSKVIEVAGIKPL